MPKHLMSIKQCHRCTRRTECSLKNDPSNVIEKPKRILVALSDRRIRKLVDKNPPSVPDPTVVYSFCNDFKVEKPKSE